MSTMLKKLSVCLLAAVLIASGCASRQSGGGKGESASSDLLKPLDPPAKVRVGMKGVPSDAGVIIGLYKGYFKELGLDVEVFSFNSGQEMINPLAGGHLDVGMAVTDAAMFNAFLRQIPVKIVADKGYNIPGRAYYQLVIRKDLENQIKDYKDLKGRTLAVVATASLDEICLDRALKAGGFSTISPEVKITVIKSFPDMLAALANKSIDGAMLIEPWIAQGEKMGVLKRFRDPSEFDRDAQIAIVIYGDGILKRPEVAKRFMVGYLKALRDYNDAFVKNKGTEQVIDILASKSLTKDKEMYRLMNPAGLNPNGYVNVKGLEADVKWYEERGLLKGDLKVEEVVDNQFVDSAIQAIGKYQ
ncbi:MAG TPA: ABC transporter substrate-binding protein [Firmicutes bacterium]|nr:ABC transporter substrate-binding protein [Bacillota bacterium]